MMSYVHPDRELLGEPTLEEMLADPIVRLIMKRDGVEESDMRRQIDRVKRHYADYENMQ